MTGDETAVVTSIGTVVGFLGSGVGGALLMAIGNAVIARVTNRHKDAREKAEAEEAGHDRRVEREAKRAARAERGERYHRARADRMHGNTNDLLDAFSLNRRIAIDNDVPEELLLEAPTPRPITAEETENAP